MSPKRFIIILILFTCGIQVQSQSLLRRFREAGTEPEKIAKLQHEATAKASAIYAAAALSLQAAVERDLARKRAVFNRARHMIDSCIAANPENIEYRFVRYVIQLHAPTVLGYNKHLNSDHAFLAEKMPAIKDEELRDAIASVLKNKDANKL